MQETKQIVENEAQFAYRKIPLVMVLYRKPTFGKVALGIRTDVHQTNSDASDNAIY